MSAAETISFDLPTAVCLWRSLLPVPLHLGLLWRLRRARRPALLRLLQDVGERRQDVHLRSSAEADACLRQVRQAASPPGAPPRGSRT